MVGNINYGGRVTDDWDRRCLDVLMRRFVRPDVVGGELMGQSVSFSPNDPAYVVPSALDELTLGDVRDRVTRLPDEHPAMYGLHGNATLTLDAQRSKQLHQWIVDVQPRVGGGAAASGADVVATLVAEFRQRMPLPIDRALAHQDTYRVTESGAMTSLGTVCDQEVECCNRLIAYLNRRLAALDAAMRGELVMDASLEKMHGSLLFAQVPVDWEKQGYPSLKPLGSWFADLIQRVEFFRDWNDTGVPTSCWLGAFFFPQGFLTGVLQTHSRQHKLPIDSLRFVVHPTAETDAALAELPIVDNGIYVHGLSLEGARWDIPTGGLAEPRPRELFSPMPILHMEPVTDAPGLHESEQGRALYECPVYKIASRAGVLSTTGISSNFVQALRISAGVESPEHWILRGAALISTLSE
jgi:dynein heavy chain